MNYYFPKQLLLHRCKMPTVAYMSRENVSCVSNLFVHSLRLVVTTRPRHLPADIFGNRGCSVVSDTVLIIAALLHVSEILVLARSVPLLTVLRHIWANPYGIAVQKSHVFLEYKCGPLTVVFPTN